MKSAAHTLRSPVRLFLAVMLFLMLPFIGAMPRAAAMSNHTMHTADASVDCATACARAASMPSPQAILHDNSARLPDLTPQDVVPHHVLFAVTHIPRVLKPSAFYRSSPSRPPDILKMSGNFRF